MTGHPLLCVLSALCGLFNCEDLTAEGLENAETIPLHLR
jgi:hypothetical protein